MKDNIWYHFEELLLTKNMFFSDIRVGQICKQSNVHRSTFYRHFEDKYQLLEFGLGKIWLDYFDLPEKNRVFKPFQTAEIFYTQSKGEKLINKHLGDDNFLFTVNQFFLKEMKKTVIEILPDDMTLPKELLANFAVTTIEVVENWQQETNQDLTSQELDSYYYELIRSNLVLDLSQ